ncbi:MAG: hypothetical protein AAGD33_21465 [Actinomycetota bacterium]
MRQTKQVRVVVEGESPSGRGCLAAFSSGVPLPETSSLNLARPNDVRSNAAVVAIGEIAGRGSIDVFSSAGADVAVDVTGWFTSDG